MKSKITLRDNHGFERGDLLRIPIKNSLFSVMWHWLIRKPLRQFDDYIVIEALERELTVEPKDENSK